MELLFGLLTLTALVCVLYFNVRTYRSLCWLEARKQAELDVLEAEEALRDGEFVPLEALQREIWTFH